ncbi:hypothetical protein M885DRAFT_258552 [Pelagophyceae sp. CCMP2097]|nr:hypothetical protein M885DRAFT_258552 [Pelagophyceae sp. CCMP2097]
MRLCGAALWAVAASQSPSGAAFAPPLFAQTPPATVVVVTLSAHYTDFYENWVEWVRRSGVHDEAGLVTIAEDEQVSAYLCTLHSRKLANTFAAHAVVSSRNEALGGHLGFETPGFASLMQRRAHYISRILDQLASLPPWLTNPKSRLIFSDLDAVWLRDPRPFFRQPGCDAWAQTQHEQRRLLAPRRASAQPARL